MLFDFIIQDLQYYHYKLVDRILIDLAYKNIDKCLEIILTLLLTLAYFILNFEDYLSIKSFSFNSLCIVPTKLII